MSTKLQPKEINTAYLAEVFTIQELRGNLNKYIEVGNQQRGIVIHPNGDVKVLNTGRHKVLSAWQRLSGKGIGLVTGVYLSLIHI